MFAYINTKLKTNFQNYKYIIIKDITDINYVNTILN